MELIIIAFCILMNAALAGAEMAFISLGKLRLQKLAQAGEKKAAALLRLKESPERTLSIIQIGITLVGMLAAAVGGAGAEQELVPVLRSTFNLSGPIAGACAVLVVVVPITYLSVVFGELIPKTLALRNPTSYALMTVGLLVWLERLFGAFVTFLAWSTRTFLRLFTRSRAHGDAVSESRLDIDHLSKTHRQYVVNLVNIESKKVRDIMLPWAAVTTVSMSCSAAQLEEIVLDSGHTRLPIMKNSEIAGILHTKEFLSFRGLGGEDWILLMRPALFFNPHAPILEALRQLQSTRSHMGIVREAGAAIGIITLEDIVEEIIGEIYDEDDDGRVKGILASAMRFRPLQ
jgi:putative hemolysin